MATDPEHSSSPGPSAKEGADKAPREPARTRIPVVVWYGLAVLIILLLGKAQMDEQVKPLTYSEFRALLPQGKVESVVILETQIRGQWKKPAGEESAKPRVFVVERGGIADPELRADLDRHGVPYAGERASRIVEAIIGPVISVVLVGLILLFVMRRMGGGPEAVFSVGKSKAKVYMDSDVRTTFKDVAGVDEAVEEVKEIVEFLRSPERFKRLGAQIPKGVLLVGLPGTGKTILARALAGEAKVPFFHLSGSDFIELFAGLGAARVRDLFKQAKEKAPCIVFVDELDAIGRARTQSLSGAGEERDQTLNAMLVEMDGFEPNNGVVMIGATNRPEILDPALLRPGRFDRQVVVDRPDQGGRRAILSVHAKNKKLSKDVDLAQIAQRTVGMVGADLASVLNEAALLAGRKGREEVLPADIDEAIDRVMAGLEKKRRVLTPKEREVVAYHEAGHALCTLLLPSAEKTLHKVSIVPRGPAALGLTWYKQTEDRFIHSRAEMKDQMVVTLGGRAAEEIVFKEITSGAGNDLERVTELARRMVKELGMSEKLGLVSYEGPRRSRFLELSGGDGPRDHSEETTREIDLEVKRLVDEAYVRAKDLLLEGRPALERIAKRLLEVEVIDRAELDRLLKEPAPAGAAASAPVPPAQGPAAVPPPA